MVDRTQGGNTESELRSEELRLLATYLAILDGIVLTYLVGAVDWSSDWEPTLVRVYCAAVAFCGNLVLWPIYLISMRRRIGNFVLVAKALATALFMPLSLGIINLLILVVMEMGAY